MRTRTGALAPGECLVLVRLQEGAEFKEIAQDFGVSVNTATTWAKRAYRKLGVGNRYEAAEKHRRLRDHVCHHLRLEQEQEAAI